MSDSIALDHKVESLRPTRGELACIVIAALAAMLVSIVFARQRGFWLDEYFTLQAVRQSWAGLIRDRLHAGHSPLYFFYAKLFFSEGAGERLLRLSSAVAMGVATGGVGLLGIALGLRKWLPGVLLAAVLQPYWINAGTQFRYMSCLLAVAVFVLWTAVLHTRRPRLGSGLWLALCACLMLWIHATAQFVLGALLLFMIAEGFADTRLPRGKALILRIWPLLLALLGSVPLLLLIRGHSDASISDESFASKSFYRSVTGAMLGDWDFWPNALDHQSKYYLLFLAFTVCGIVFQGFRTFKAAGNLRAVRFVLILLIGLPTIVLLFQFSGNYFRLEKRYVACISIPFIFCVVAAVAALWSSRRPLAILIGMVVLAQFLASALTPGDRHREALNWAMANATDDTPLMACLTRSTRMGLEMNGYQRQLAPSIDTRERDPEKIQQWLRNGLNGQKRGLIILYKTKLPLVKAMRKMQKAGEIVDARRWKLTSPTTVIAFTTDPSEAGWLAAVKPPETFMQRTREDDLD